MSRDGSVAPISRVGLSPGPLAGDFHSKIFNNTNNLAHLAEHPSLPIYSRAISQRLAGLKMTITVPPDYRPTEKEPFMNPKQQAYFRRKLLNWRVELLKESEETLESLQQEGGAQEPDLADRASTEMERSLELRTRDRARKLISKIAAALHRIEEGTYGYCEETGEPISLKRLEARPIATLSIEAQERHERMERTHRSD